MNAEPVALLLTPEEAARALRVGRSKVYDLMRAGQLRSVKIGGSRRVSAQALADYVAALERKTAAGPANAQDAGATAKAPSTSFRTAAGAAQSSSDTGTASRTGST
jgi:excisionase family DNA binding protein